MREQKNVLNDRLLRRAPYKIPVIKLRVTVPNDRFDGFPGALEGIYRHVSMSILRTELKSQPKQGYAVGQKVRSEER
jgi:hypothetical protein